MIYEKVVFEKDKIESVIRENQIKSLDLGADRNFKDGQFAMCSAYKVPDAFYHKIVKLSRSADWVIKEYCGGLYLIALKKDC